MPWERDLKYYPIPYFRGMNTRNPRPAPPESLYIKNMHVTPDGMLIKRRGLVRIIDTAGLTGFTARPVWGMNLIHTIGGSRALLYVAGQQVIYALNFYAAGTASGSPPVTPGNTFILPDTTTGPLTTGAGGDPDVFAEVIAFLGYGFIFHGVAFVNPTPVIPGAGSANPRPTAGPLVISFSTTPPTAYYLGIQDLTTSDGPALAVGNPVGLTGIYQYKFAYEDTFGNVGNPSRARSITVGNTQINITVPKSLDPKITNIRIYRTTASGTTFYYLKTIANTGGNTILTTDGAADSTLPTTTNLPQLDNFPPPGDIAFAFVHQRRLWVYGVRTLSGVNFPASYLFPSKVDNFESFDPSVRNVRVPALDQYPVKGAFMLNGLPYVYTSQVTYRLIGDDPTNWELVPTEGKGSVSRFGVASLKHGHAFVWTDQGLMKFNGITYEDISDAVFNRYTSLNGSVNTWSRTMVTFSTFENEALVLSTQTLNGGDIIFCYNNEVRSWSEWSGFGNVSGAVQLTFALTLPAGSAGQTAYDLSADWSLVYFGSSLGKVYCLDIVKQGGESPPTTFLQNSEGTQLNIESIADFYLDFGGDLRKSKSIRGFDALFRKGTINRLEPYASASDFGQQSLTFELWENTWNTALTPKALGTVTIASSSPGSNQRFFRLRATTQNKFNFGTLRLRNSNNEGVVLCGLWIWYQEYGTEDPPFPSS